ncbi:recombination directionality factor [Orenia marismortui]|uniref:recombination directionality factor n=1 Tax=Orenia marismortui TaxID=46469 RepID=UPI000365510B|nr:hypothetical protein [Orenia marismortui]
MFREISEFKDNVQIPEVFKIKDGERREDSGLPNQLSYLKITDTNKANGNFKQNKRAIELYKEKPTEIDIILMHDDIGKVFPHWFSAYKGNVKVCEGDGNQSIFYGMTGDKDPVTGICQGSDCPCAEKRGCKPYGVFNCQIKGMEEVGGCAKYRPKGFKKVKAILDSLKMIKSKTGGILEGIPLKLAIQPYADDYEKKGGGKGATTNYFTHVKFSGSNTQLIREVVRVKKERLEIKSQLERLENINLFEEEIDFLESSNIESDETEFQNPALNEQLRKESESLEKELNQRYPKGEKEEITDQEAEEQKELTPEQKEILEIKESSKLAKEIITEFLSHIKFNYVEDLPEGYAKGLLKKLKSKAS